ncbi:MAG TPA: hypothetical protein PKY38_09810, partial [Opitutaceae bacterium]|nr:hypothetical protein [Opitutaceae bacterium]
MRAREKHSQAGWRLLLIGAVLAGAAWFIRAYHRPMLPAPTPEYVALLAEHEALREYTDEVLASWRQRSSAVQERVWSVAAISSLRQELGADWQWHPEANDRVRVRAAEPQLSRWRDYVTLVTALGERPGVVVESFAAHAEGAGALRQLADVGLTLRFLVPMATMGDGERSSPSLGAHPVAAALGPAMPRQVGSGSALRLPA